ncbi:class B secretin-like G-protein coupled receptor GPRcal1, putative [Pediculus humanus corporis]|uniref:Class B secretin-like G-protein coupled receptor GPRcal1, putative n=1 Tax=Pediculus humanus subsp. corporis TaxID=121224 RepID=E0VT86_PEDHC|nr:class B secretin-like G-protein coupled receptor GPRcal1, putative [Pediculus humanus corporis]EEB16592.1 class B secretin-like G-protein coupled receptor GPRcal1, putative [Pediculus humanus corporis]
MPANFVIGGLYCEGTFDGWSCWPDTPAGTTANVSCPGFVTGFDPKQCDSNGSWYKHPETQKPWSNYTTCVDQEDLSARLTINQIYEIGYLISLIALLASLAIYTYFKSLRCSRTTLHIHLFVSFAVNNALWLIWYRFILGDPNVIKENGVACRIFHVVLHYFLMTNYSWMLCEGLYLHTLLVNAFLSEERLVRWLFVLGWAIPGIAIIVYLSLRANGQGEEITHCWMNETKYTNVLVVPVFISMVLNLVFLCNIVRVLMTKLRAGPHVGSQRPSRTLLQAFRATLLLVPLLGLHYLLTPFRPEKGHAWEFFYEVLSAITASLQGLCVATLFCFCNGEVSKNFFFFFCSGKICGLAVISQIKRRYQFAIFRNRANSCTATTVSFIRSTPPMAGEEKV